MNKSQQYPNSRKKRKSKTSIWVKLQMALIFLLIVLITLLLANVVSNIIEKNNKQTNSVPVVSYEDAIGKASSIDPDADNKYRQEQYRQAMDQFSDVILPYNDKEKNYIPNTLFIGDSNTNGLSAYFYLPLQQVIGVPSMGIQSVRDKQCVWFSGLEEPLTIPQAVSQLKPRRIIINFGTNNTVGMDAEGFAATYKSAINAIKKQYKYSDIIVASIFPVGKKRVNMSVTMQTIDKFNLALAQLCRDEGYQFLDTTQEFKDETGFIKKEYSAKDGLHLTADGYKAYIEYVNTHQYTTSDTRPPRDYIPQRCEAPVVEESQPEIEQETAGQAIS